MNTLNLFDHQHYAKLRSISEVLDYVCTCKTEYNNFTIIKKDIECNYGTYQNCKFIVGKQYFCIINPEGQLRRKRDVRHLESMVSNSLNKNRLILIVSMRYRLKIIYFSEFNENIFYNIQKENISNQS